MRQHYKHRKHKLNCSRCDIGMSDCVDRWQINGGICDDCVHELATGKIEINAPVELAVRSTFNFPQSHISRTEDARHTTGGRG